jgi:glycosyltransferase involved in cell wall biosynthesis
MDNLRKAGVPTVTLDMEVAISPFRDLRALKQLRAILKTLQPDLVSTHSSKAGALGRVAARSLNVPVIHTAHGWSFTVGIPSRQAALYRRVEWMAALMAAKIITVSDFDRQLAISQGVAAGDKLVTIHNGMPDIDQALRADPSRSPVRMAMIARFEPQKDHKTLFHALAGLRNQEWHLDLIGDGPLLPQTQELARQLGVADRCQFWGQRMDVAARLAEVQAALLITNWEGFPRSILEAMRAGLPVIASSVGGIAESVRDGETGFTVPRGDVHLLRERLQQLLADPDLRTRMGQRARKRYEQEFTLEHTVTRTLNVYHDLIQGARPAVRSA